MVLIVWPLMLRASNMFNLVWKGEVIDSFDTLKEASDMAREYTMAYGGHVNILKGKTQ